MARIIRQNELFNHLQCQNIYFTLICSSVYNPTAITFPQHWFPYGSSCDGSPAGLLFSLILLLNVLPCIPTHHCHHLTSYMWLGQFFFFFKCGFHKSLSESRTHESQFLVILQIADSCIYKCVCFNANCSIIHTLLLTI